MKSPASQFPNSQTSEPQTIDLETADLETADSASNLDDLKNLMLDTVLDIVPFDGWTAKTLTQAANTIPLDKGLVYQLFPRGALDVIAYWSRRMDAQAQAQIADLNLSEMRIRDKIIDAVWIRLHMLDGHETAARRAVSRLSLPDAHINPMGSQATRQIWASADMIWRAIGDRSTDSNYYSKRTILSGVLTSTTLAWLSDESVDKTSTRSFLDARIADVMRIESAKFAIKKRTQNLPNPAEVLGRLRYGLPLSRRRYRGPARAKRRY